MDFHQLLFTLFAAIVFLYQVANGWRLGLVLQLLRLAALGAAYLAARGMGPGLVPFLRGGLGYPDSVLLALGWMLAGVATYFFITLAGRILFKKTSQQESGIIWLVYGGSGALLGLLFSALLVWAAVCAVRLAGSVHKAWEGRAGKVSMASAALSGLHHAVETGTVGEIFRTLDPLPQRTYRIAEKLGRVAANPEALARWIQSPEAKELAAQPEIQALWKDPQILQNMQKGEIFALLRNEKIVKAANSPKVAQLWEELDVEKALDFALQA